jgi:hypothetical protein
MLCTLHAYVSWHEYLLDPVTRKSREVHDLNIADVVRHTQICLNRPILLGYREIAKIEPP